MSRFSSPLPLSALVLLLLFSILALASCDNSLADFQHKMLKGTTDDSGTQAYMIFTETKMTIEIFFGAASRKVPGNPGIFSFSGDLEVSDSEFMVTPSVLYNATGIDETISVQFKSALQTIRFSIDDDTLNTRIVIQGAKSIAIDVAWKLAPLTRGAAQLNKMHPKASQVFGYYESHKATYLKPTPFSPFLYYDTIVVNECGYFLTDAGVRQTNATVAPNFDAVFSVTGELDIIYHEDQDVYQLHASPLVELSGSGARGYSTELVEMDRYAQFSEDGQKMLIFVLSDGERVAEAEFYRQK